MLAMSWNVRGLGKEVKKRKVRSVVLSQKPMVLFIQESKLNVFDRNIIRSIGGYLLSRGVGVEAIGSAGGLITLWNESLFTPTDCILNRWCIVLVGKLLKQDKQVAFCNVYAPTIESERKELWGFLLNLQLSFTVPWVMGGDFNTVLLEKERRGGVFNKWSARAFNSFILHAKVIDTPLRGMEFTWSNNRESGSWARLDRFLVSLEIFLWFPDLVQREVPRSISDHNAITLGSSKKLWGPSPFRIFNGWMEDQFLTAQIKRNWIGSKVKGSSSSRLQLKLKAAMYVIKKWAVEKSKDRLSTKDCESRLGKLEENGVLEGWSDSLRKERVSIMAEFWKILRVEEQEWRQKSRVKWLTEGDRNSRFFHCVANGRRRNNLIEDIHFGGIKKSKPHEIKEEIAVYFETFYKNVNWRRPNIRGLPIKKLTEVERDLLEAKFDKDEVWAALSSCDGNKAPGPDGFNLNFIKSNWDVVGRDFMKFMEDFHKDGSVVKELNKTFIALIPKTVKPENMLDFRPISLVSSLYKVLAKTLANRMKRIMGSVIGEAQTTFVNNRQILDSFIVAEEIIHHWKRSKEGGLLVKLDFEKAYDSLDHSFVDNMLKKMGFGRKWRQWMFCCMSTPELSVLVNGSPTRQFRMQRGLCQGDPLSLFSSLWQWKG
ncbi:hypothetical protein Dsin_001206 [Dipteronia sinensis]|uniref:Reverse transcriptase domain-containing protein n=1 Tax=Dipteronia sinensis TaxID=43782 RepID=A0AAE0B4V2_9ROSI|nr:hypothetical protein Dsin_001206 [Dipteronia sinensis]